MRLGLALCLGIVVASVAGAVDAQTPAKPPEQRPAGEKPAVPQSPADSARQACEAEDAAQCVRLAAMYRQGEGVPKDGAKAGELLARGCAAKEMKACFDLADMHWRGEVTGWVDGSGALDAFSEGVAIDEAKALAMHQVACDAGDAKGCFFLGTLFAHAVARDQAKAAQLFEKACERGDSRGCFSLGEMYKDGQGLAEDAAKAARLFKQACDGGDARGCCSLGLMVMSGQGVERDQAEAARLREKACDAGVAEGCVTLSLMYRSGEGVAKNEAKAVQLLAKAAAAKATATEEPDQPLKPYRTIGVDGSEIAVVAFFRRPPDFHLAGLNREGKLAVDRRLRVYSGQKDIKLTNGGEVSVFWFNDQVYSLFYQSRDGKTVLVNDTTKSDLSTSLFEDLGKDIIRRIVFRDGRAMTVVDSVAYAKLLTAKGWSGKPVVAILVFLVGHLHIGALDKDGNLAKGLGQVVAIYDSEKLAGGLFVSENGPNLAQIGRELSVQDDNKLVSFKEIQASAELREKYLTPNSDAAALAEQLKNGGRGQLSMKDGRVVLVSD